MSEESTKANEPEFAIDKSETLARDGVRPIGAVEFAAHGGSPEADAPACPVCGTSREMMAPQEPCAVCGKQLEDAP